MEKPKLLKLLIDKVMNASLLANAKASEKAKERFKFLTGAYDNRDKVKSRNLANVIPGDEVKLEQLGAKLIDGQWIVPKGVALEPFRMWWPKIPKDVMRADIDSLRVTSNGEPLNLHVLPEDTLKGGDSTATSVLLIAFPVLAALTYLLSTLPGVATWMALGVGLLATLPYGLVLLKTEGFKRVFLSYLTFIVPLAGLMSNLEDAMKSGQGAMIVIALALVYTIFRSFDRQGIVGGWLSRFMKAARWSFGFAGLFIVMTLILPAWASSFVWFVICCTHAMNYTQSNYDAKYTSLAYTGLDHQGALSFSNDRIMDKALDRQAIDAVNDKTSIIYLAESQGKAAAQGFRFGYAAGQPIGLSVRDLSMHKMVFGKTGSGKTASVLQPIILQLSQLEEPIGMIITCGKMVLPNECREIANTMIEPGIKFAPFQGLLPNQIVAALSKATGSGGDDKDAIWSKGAMNYETHTLWILHALVEHEKNVIEWAKQGLLRTAKEIKFCITEKEIEQREGRDAEFVVTKIKQLREKLEFFDKQSKERKWFYHPHAWTETVSMFAVVKNSNIGNVLGEEAAKALSYLGVRAKLEREQFYPETIHKGLSRKGGELWLAVHFLMNSWTNYADEQRSSFLLNVDADLQDLTNNGSTLCDENGTPWSMTEEGYNVGGVLYGDKIGVFLPPYRFQRTGIILARLAKQLIYTGVYERGELISKYGDKWMEVTGQTYVADICDECQELITDLELKMLPMSRSLGGFAIFATQQIQSLAKVFDTQQSLTEFANTFQTITAFNTSQETLTFLRELVGEAKLTKFKSMAGKMLDYNQVSLVYKQSPFSSVSHDGWAMMQHIEREGGAQIIAASDIRQQDMVGNHKKGAKHTAAKLNEMGTAIVINDQPETEDRYVLNQADMKAILSGRGAGIVIVERAGVRRVDYANFVPLGAENFKRFAENYRQNGIRFDYLAYAKEFKEKNL